MELMWNCDLVETWEKNNSLPNLPGAYYFSEFLTENESKNLSAFCKEVPKTKRGYISGLSGPKVKIFSEDSYPPALVTLINKMKEKSVFRADPVQISINEYTVDDRMIPHKDGLGNIGVIVSLGGTSILDFHHKPATFDLTRTEIFLKSGGEGKGEREEFTINDDPDVSVFMEPGSVLIMSGEAFINYAHAIEARQEDIVSENLGNIHLISSKYQINEVIPRKTPRFSLVLWDSREVISIKKMEKQSQFII